MLLNELNSHNMHKWKERKKKKIESNRMQRIQNPIINLTIWYIYILGCCIRRVLLQCGICYLIKLARSFVFVCIANKWIYWVQAWVLPVGNWWIRYTNTTHVWILLLLFISETNVSGCYFPEGRTTQRKLKIECTESKQASNISTNHIDINIDSR